MTMTERESALRRVWVPLVIVAGVIFLWESGRAFGQWLRAVLN
jgi:hypothetical protein